jgi:integrase
VNITTNWIMAHVREPRDKAQDYADSEVPGLTARISVAGIVTWSTRRRMADNRYTRVTIGRYPEVSIAEARKQARKVQGAMQTGGDPVAEKRAARAKAIADKARPTLVDCWRDYAHAKIGGGQWGETHATNANKFFARVVAPALGTRALADISRADWTHLITAEGKKGRGAKANALRTIRGFDNYSETVGWIERAVLPRKVEMLAPPCPPRQHTPSDDAIVAISNAATGLRPKARVYIRLLILTAARRGEVAGIRASEVDRDAGLWRLPAARTKNKISHTMPLGALALCELQSIWPTEPVSPRCCLLGGGGYSGFQDFGRTKAALAAALGNDEWRIHDLRRAARSAMARLGIVSDHAEAALNHVSHRSALERTYNTHNYEDEAVAALRVWQGRVARLVQKSDDVEAGAEVVPIRRLG